ncbi:MAG: NUDIX hydrolase [Leptolyngbya sp. SIO4C1]|nr:NUDIX hydrolase [Leptolyngbya sp. SIO4C1]
MGKLRIRPISLGLVKHQAHVLVSQGQDTVSGDTFYRFLGGGIDFGETSRTALQREFQEEIQAALTNIRYLGCLENIFTCHGKAGHELIQLFGCDFVDPQFYQLNQTFSFVEGKKQRSAVWIPIERIHTGELNLVPLSCRAFLG